MAHKQRRLENKGWDSATAALVIDSPKEKREQKGYNSIQQRYISWAKSRGIDPEQPNPAQLLNWLTTGVLIQGWHADTIQNYKSAIIYRYEDKSPFLDPDFLSYFQDIKERSVKDTKEIDIDLQYNGHNVFPCLEIQSRRSYRWDHHSYQQFRTRKRPLPDHL